MRLNRAIFLPIFVSLYLASLILFLSRHPAWAKQTERIPWAMTNDYAGPHQNSFERLRYDIPPLIRQTVIDLSVKLGLPYQEGWLYPLTIRFASPAEERAENLLAFVVLYSTGDGIKQDLVVNLAAYEKTKFDFKKVFSHELVHAMMNDSVGAEAALVIPVWLQEGLALYGADQGEQVMKSYVHQNSGFAKQKLLNGLDGPHGALDYAEDYLAVKYIRDQHGPNAIPLFLRELIERKGDIKGAYEYATNQEWADFLDNARKFAAEAIEQIGPARRGEYEQPY